MNDNSNSDEIKELKIYVVSMVMMLAAVVVISSIPRFFYAWGKQ